MSRVPMADVKAQLVRDHIHDMDVEMRLTNFRVTGQYVPAASYFTH